MDQRYFICLHLAGKKLENLSIGTYITSNSTKFIDHATQNIHFSYVYGISYVSEDFNYIHPQSCYRVFLILYVGYPSVCIWQIFLWAVGTNVAAKFLRANGITLFQVRDETLKLLGKADMFFFSPEHPPLTEEAQRALDWAVDEKLKSGWFSSFSNLLLFSTNHRRVKCFLCSQYDFKHS